MASDNTAGRVGELIAVLARQRSATVAAAESLTGGQLSSALAAAPDAQDWYLGAVVASPEHVVEATVDCALTMLLEHLEGRARRSSGAAHPDPLSAGSTCWAGRTGVR